MALTSLQVKLLDEYYRRERNKDIYEQALLACPKGYIARRMVNGNLHHYLQWREQNKIRSKYLKNSEVAEINAGILRRKELEHTLSELQVDMRLLHKALGKKVIDEYRGKI